MVAMVQRLDASHFFFHALLNVFALLALVLKVFRNRFRRHGQIVAELLPFNLSNFVHSLTIHYVEVWSLHLKCVYPYNFSSLSKNER
jgi:hypothetical protein